MACTSKYPLIFIVLRKLIFNTVTTLASILETKVTLSYVYCDFAWNMQSVFVTITFRECLSEGWEIFSAVMEYSEHISC